MNITDYFEEDGIQRDSFHLKRLHEVKNLQCNNCYKHVHICESCRKRFKDKEDVYCYGPAARKGGHFCIECKEKLINSDLKETNLRGN